MYITSGCKEQLNNTYCYSKHLVTTDFFIVTNLCGCSWQVIPSFLPHRVCYISVHFLCHCYCLLQIQTCNSTDVGFLSMYMYKCILWSTAIQYPVLSSAVQYPVLSSAYLHAFPGSPRPTRGQLSAIVERTAGIYSSFFHSFFTFSFILLFYSFFLMTLNGEVGGICLVLLIIVIY